MTKWLFNPFTYIAGFKSLLLGWAFMLLTAVAAYFTHTHFDGVVDTHFGNSPAWAYFIEPLINWVCLTSLFFAIGQFFSASDIRLIDVAGTFALARSPLLIMALTGGVFKGVTHTASLAPLQYAMLLLHLLLTIWLIILYFNAFRVSCNFKGNRATAFFIAGLVVAEVISRVIFQYLYKPFM
jgi:hypothetical protein